MERTDTSLIKNEEYFREKLKVDENFDVIYRKISVGGRDAGFFFIDGFAKDELIEKLQDFFYSITPEDMPKDAGEFLTHKLPYMEVEKTSDTEQIITNVLSGVLCLFIDGYEECLAIDSRTYPARSVEEPDKDKVLRGSRDGFVETIVFNTALIRRRIRTPELKMEMISIGESSKTDVVLCYMSDRAEKILVDKVRRRLKSIEVDALSMNQESLSESFYHRKWFNPFPKFKYTERPDTAAASILEGKICILVDNAPAAMLFPMTIFGITEEANDYYFPPITGSYLRLTRCIISILAVILTPLWLLLIQNPQWIPQTFSFIQIKDPVNLPILVQLFILEFAIDGLKLAAINTPNMLTTPLSVIAALVVGDYAVNSGWFNGETLLYMAFVAIANYTQASYELGYALKFMRLILLALTGIFGLWGFIGGLILILLLMLGNKTVSGESYLEPLIPFRGKKLVKRLLRMKIQSKHKLE